MKRLLLPLLAAIALPTAANAETIWLMVHGKGSSSHAGYVSWKIPMESMQQCQTAALKIKGSKTINIHHMKSFGYVCVKGK